MSRIVKVRTGATANTKSVVSGCVLIAFVENEAHQWGCKRAFLDTFGFQAHGFYQKPGYSEFGWLNEFSGEHEWHYLRKKLDSVNASATAF